ncbi:MAG TPA: hypothetical protein VGD48_19425, partial [Kutzneria sp.]
MVNAVPATAAPPPRSMVAKEASPSKPSDFGPDAARSTDLAINGWGDAAGYHIEVGRESSGFA